jgi:hypothetical protein
MVFFLSLRYLTILQYFVIAMDGSGLWAAANVSGYDDEPDYFMLQAEHLKEGLYPLRAG